MSLCNAWDVLRRAATANIEPDYDNHFFGKSAEQHVKNNRDLDINSSFIHNWVSGTAEER
jgi:hypothetical protein